MPEMNMNNQNNKNVEELVRSIPILAATGNTDAVNRVLDLIQEMRNSMPAEELPADTENVHYLYARELTLRDGSKHYHPMVGAMTSIEDVTNPAAYKMLSKPTILELQDDWQATGQKEMAERAGYRIKAVCVTDEVYAELEKQLFELMTSVINGVKGGVRQVMVAVQQLNDGINEETISKLILQEATKKPYVSGSAVNKDGEVVEKGEYVDEIVETPKDNDEPEDCDHDCEECDDYSVDCDRCCRTCDCGEMGMCGGL